ncbi:erv26 super protein [Spiromyces aspiralis]|uniref:Erv26 super protein n=1 Tax=Spiromyces aspiralis TaxID=68401 RepID=A0ACC1HT47_9FUNG|nr:erv26 super protein [Spiromyces aspiralis]
MVPTENFPLLQTAISLIFFFIYDMNSRTFPFTTVYSLPFIGSCVSIVCHHFMWFYYFIHTPHNYSFTAVVSFMLICVWAVPFSYFVSLSTTDIALLDSAAPAPGNARHRKRTNLFRSLLGFLERSGKQPDNFDTDIDGRDAGPDRTLSASSRPFSSAWDQKLE